MAAGRGGVTGAAAGGELGAAPVPPSTATPLPLLPPLESLMGVTTSCKGPARA